MSRTAYMTRSSLAAELQVFPADIDEMVREGALPPPLITNPEPYWEWDEVDAHILDQQRTSTVPPSGWVVYVVGFANYVKIGFTRNDVRYRVANLQCGCPETIEVYSTFPGIPADEAALHRRFGALRLRGEWFRREGNLASWIDAGCPS